MLRLRSREAEPKMYTIEAAARECGVSAQTLRWLETRKVVQPRRAIDPSGSIRVYSERDLQDVQAHYRKVGGVRRPHTK